MGNQKKLIHQAVKMAGSQKKLASAVGLTQQGISYLLNSANRVSAETALAIDRFSNGKIPKEKLRPDIFGCGHE